MAAAAGGRAGPSGRVSGVPLRGGRPAQDGHLDERLGQRALRQQPPHRRAAALQRGGALQPAHRPRRDGGRRSVRVHRGGLRHRDRHPHRAA